MLEWKKHDCDISPSTKIESQGFYLGRIMEMYFSNGMVEFFDGSDQCFCEELTPEQAKDLLRQAIEIIDKHSKPVD